MKREDLADPANQGLLSPPGPSGHPAERLRRLIATCRLAEVGLHPHVSSNFLAEGVLHDTGITMWEIPWDTSTSWVRAGGYNHALSRPNAARTYASYVDYNRYPNDISQLDVDSLRFGLFRVEMNFLPQDWPKYGPPATSVCTQFPVLSPIHVGGTNFAFYRYPELAPLVALARRDGMRFYANIGLANNGVFWSGELAFNILYAMKADQPANPPRMRVGVHVPPIQPDDFILERAAPSGAGAFGDHLAWPHVVYDPTHPDVLRMAREQIAYMARTYPTVWFLVNGESIISFARRCGFEPITAANCDRCAPRSNFSASAVAGFQNYMRRVEPDVAVLNLRWQLQGTAIIGDHREIDPRIRHHCPYFLAMRDYNRFQAMLWEEAIRQSYHAGKVENPTGMFAQLTFGPSAMERGWLESDFAASGNYYITDTNQLPRDDEEVMGGLYVIANAARLSGLPASLAISSPAAGHCRPVILGGFRHLFHSCFSSGIWNARDSCSRTSTHCTCAIS